MISFLLAGTLLGLSAGFTPGPLLTLVISETLRHDIKAGMKVAMAPALTDAPIIILALFLMTSLNNFHGVLGVISLIGGVVIVYMGYESFRIKGVTVNLNAGKPRSLRKGFMVNALNPSPYLFWFSVGGPTILRAMDQSAFSAVAFVASFYILIIGTKAALAVVVSRSKGFLSSVAYIRIMRVLGLFLFIFAAFLFRDGLRLLGFL